MGLAIWVWNYEQYTCQGFNKLKKYFHGILFTSQYMTSKLMLSCCIFFSNFKFTLSYSTKVTPKIKQGYEFLSFFWYHYRYEWMNDEQHAIVELTLAQYSVIFLTPLVLKSIPSCFSRYFALVCHSLSLYSSFNSFLFTILFVHS